MSNFWDEWPKPWAREQCRDYYIRRPHDVPTLEQLAQISGVPYGSIKRWKCPEWASARDEYIEQLRRSTVDKSVEAVATDLAVLEIQHVEAYQLLRQCAMAKVRALKTKIDQAADDAKIVPGIDLESLGDLGQADREAQATAKAEVVKETDVQDLRQLSGVIDLAIKGERLILGGEYEDLNKAVAAMTRAGLKITAPNMYRRGPDGVRLEGEVVLNGVADE
jgi:hypothetical protein